MPGPVRVERVELVRVRMPLRAAFRTARGSTATKDALLVHVLTADGEGWGECGAEAEPTYAPETVDSARAALRDHLVPRLLAGRDLDEVRGHGFAKAALRTALLDARLRADGTALAAFLGARRPTVPAGITIGRMGPQDLKAAVEDAIAAGYRRVKVKIAPGDDDAVHIARAAAGAGVELHADANGAYDLADADHLRTLAADDLTVLEQPLAPDALLDHAALATRIPTTVALDETVGSVRVARDALALAACGAIVVKAGRLGGLEGAVAVHDLCVASGVPAICGGMLDTGVGRAVNVALAALPGFTLVGDLSASDRWFAEDITEPFVLDGGTLRVPSGAGIGVTPVPERLRECTYAREAITRR